jgi:hypothetical protein
VAGNLINFDITGPGKIIGVGNGDPSCHEPDVYVERWSRIPRWQRSAFNGLAEILVQSTKAAGEIELTARANGLSPTTLRIQSQPGLRSARSAGNGMDATGCDMGLVSAITPFRRLATSQETPFHIPNGSHRRRCG